MMPKENRLPKDRVPLVFKQGRRYSLSFLTIFFRPNEENHTKIAIVVKKSAVKKATERNRIKRTLRSSASFLLKTRQIPVDIIFLVSRYPEKQSTEEMTKILFPFFEKLKAKS